MSDERKPSDAEQAAAEILAIIIGKTYIEVSDSVSTHEYEVRQEFSVLFAHDQQAVVSIIDKCLAEKAAEIERVKQQLAKALSGGIGRGEIIREQQLAEATNPSDDILSGQVKSCKSVDEMLDTLRQNWV